MKKTKCLEALWSVLFTQYYSDIITRKMRCVGHVARMGKRRDAYRVLVGRLKKEDHLEDPGVDGRIILKWIFNLLKPDIYIYVVPHR